MFPYPSGNLHLGHLRVYTVADVLYRYQSMLGLAVVQPMGWDAFGLPAENAAIDREVMPKDWTKNNIERMRTQMESTMLLGLDWSREISTCDPDYYRWTQWIFLQLFKRGLAYYRSAFVNWDPVDQTVLADELIDADGKSWRSGARVIRRPLRQWYYRTTAFSESLLDGLKEIEGNQWRDVINLQRGWLGKLDGTQMEFNIVSDESATSVPSERMPIFTRNADLAVADLISHIEVHPGSVYFDEQFRKPYHSRGPNSTRKLLLTAQPVTLINGKCCFKVSISSSTAASCWPEMLAVSAMHPYTGRSIPMVRLPCSTKSETIAFPNTLCFRLRGNDKFMAGRLLSISSPPALLRPIDRQSEAIDSIQIAENELDQYAFVTPVSELNGLQVGSAVKEAMNLLKQTGRGGHPCNEARTDWLVSRQRYWGTPIPIVHCPSCGAVPVPDDQLPVTLPDLERPLKRGDSPLKDNIKWRTTSCPKCGQQADRETDTLDTFVDSSWYYLRYLDPNNQNTLCDVGKAREALPVNIYVGGIEHATRHLYYARFMAHFLHQLGLIPCREPFLRFLPVGLVLGQTFVDPRTGRYIHSSQVTEKVNDNNNGRPMLIDRQTGNPVKMLWDKMSKSKLNGVDPTDAVSRHGVEVVRLMMLANVGPHRARKWQEDGVLRGIINWRSRLCKLVDAVVEHASANSTPQFGIDDPLSRAPNDLQSMHQSTLRRVNFYYSESFVLSAAIARLQELTDCLRHPTRLAIGLSSFAYLRALADLIVMLTPLAPVLSCELWSRLQVALQTERMRFALGRQTGNNSQLDSWPYDVDKSVLEQPFPTPKEAWSEECESNVRIGKAA